MALDIPSLIVDCLPDEIQNRIREMEIEDCFDVVCNPRKEKEGKRRQQSAEKGYTLPTISHKKKRLNSIATKENNSSANRNK